MRRGGRNDLWCTNSLSPRNVHNYLSTATPQSHTHSRVVQHEVPKYWRVCDPMIKMDNQPALGTLKKINP